MSDNRHYCVLMHSGKPLDNMYFDNQWVAAYYLGKKYKIRFSVYGKNRSLRADNPALRGDIIKVPLPKKIVKI